MLKKADQAFLQGKYLESEKLYQSYLQSYPDHSMRWEVWQQLLNIARHVRKDPRKTIDLLEAMYLEYGEEEERGWIILMDMAQEQLLLKEFDRAVKVYEQALKSGGLTPGRTFETTWKLAQALKQSGNYERSRTLMIETLDLPLTNKQRIKLLYDIAKIYLFEQNKSQAKLVLHRVLEVGLENEEVTILAKFTLADLYQHDGEKLKAKELFESIKDTYPNPLSVKARIDFLEKELAAEQPIIQ